MAYRDRLTRSTWLLLALTPLALSFVHCGGTPPTDPDGAGGVVGSGGQSADGGGSGGVVGSGGDEASGGLNGIGGQSSGGQGSGGQSSGGQGSAGEGGFGGDEGSDGGATDGDGSGGVSGSGGDGSGGIVGAGGDGSGGEGSGGAEGSGGIVGAGGDEGLGGAGLGGESATGGVTGAGGGSGGGGASECEGDEEYDELADACLVPIPCDEGAAPFGGGDGSQGSPYLICSAAHLMAMDDVATGNGKYFVLAQSLDLSLLVDFVPLAYVGGPFVGTFDGAGRALVGLSIIRPNSTFMGLFTSLGAASRVENLKLLDFTVTSTAVVGVLVGSNSGTIVGVTTSGSVAGESAVGGIAGGNLGTIENCESSVDVDALPNGNNVGGLVGMLYGEVFDSSSSGSVGGYAGVGGLVGRAEVGSIIANSVASGPVLGTNYVGGLVGMSYSVISACEASGDVDAVDLGSSSLGGLLGWTNGEVVDSRATGEVNGNSPVGGLIGDASSALIEGCEASGAVNGMGNVGGLVGYTADTYITTSRASGAVQSGPDGLGTGGLVGWLGGVIDQSVASGAVSGGSFVGGLVGRGADDGEIVNSYSTGFVNALVSVAGLVGGGFGAAGADITNSYAFGSVGVTGAGPSGGLVSTAVGFTVLSSYYLLDGAPAGPGTPLMTGQFAQQVSFTGWDFASIWIMSPSSGRPVLRWE